MVAEVRCGHEASHRKRVAAQRKHERGERRARKRVVRNQRVRAKDERHHATTEEGYEQLAGAQRPRGYCG